jgi:glutaredoxin-like protein NrdH
LTQGVGGENKMNKKVIVYTTNDCIECTMVKKVLTEEGIPFDTRNISESQEYQKEVEKFGYLGVPVTVVGDRSVKGFTNELKELIEIAKGI